MTTTEPTLTMAKHRDDDAPDRLLAHLDPPLPRLQLNLLFRNGYDTVADVAAASDAELLEIHGVGESSVAIIREALAGGEQPPPADHTTLDKLEGKMPYQLRGRLIDAGFRTVEEIAGSNQAVLKELLPAAREGSGSSPGLGCIKAAEIRAIQTSALTYLAGKYTIGGTSTIRRQQATELVALLGQLALYADLDADSALARRTSALIRHLAPGFPAPWNPARPREDQATRSYEGTDLPPA